MTAYSLRSLLVAAIILSNCITWTASRHHFTHNFHGLHSRHRRQGAGLFLPSSFVIPTKYGESETEGWGEWGDVSPCSRTCGGGVASQKRICLKIGQDGQPMCRGGDTKYFSCQTQDCPAGSQDFRAEQCAEFNDQDFRGSKYNWVPYTRSINPCELNCMPRGERFYYRHKDKVIDGTRCNDESFDVCVDGTCQPVGCDMMLGSSAREDKCRKCRGNGTNCHTSMGVIATQDLKAGYNDLLLIPAGATTIVIEELKPSSNYLALRNQNGTFYLNGYYHIDFPRNMMIAGVLCSYESSHIGLPAPDKIKCLGPIEEALYLSLLQQEPNVGIQYEYSLPSNLVTSTDKQYSWTHEEFTPCSASCGGGIQTRNVTCRTSEDLEVVDDNLCDESLKPVTNQTCNNKPCPAYWAKGPWGACSKRCGKEGRRTREINCQKIIVNRFPSLVADQECLDLHGPKPHLSEECNIDAPCPSWFVGRWKPCDKLCDEGKQTRQVVCYHKTNGRIEVLDDEECEEEKPEAEKPCLLSVCEGVDWVSSQWFGCDSCLSKVRTRQIKCVSRVSHIIVNDSLCALQPKPTTEELCDNSTLPTCIISWYAKQWSKCSVECGKGQKTRTVFCGLLDGNSIIQVSDSECDHLEKYNDTQPCEVPPEKCPAQWFTGPWSNCSEDCSGGVMYTTSMCFKGDTNSSECPDSSIPDTTKLCNNTCDNPDQLIPVNQSSPGLDPIFSDDYSDCDEEEYPEEGLDADTTNGFTNDGMLSDSPYTESDSTSSPETGSGSYAEPESTLTTDGGSGFGSSLTSDDFLSLSPKDTTDPTIEVDADYTTGSGDDDISSGESSSDQTKSTESTITDGSSITEEMDSIKSTVTENTSISGETSPTNSTVTDGTSLSSATGFKESTITDGSSISGETDSAESTVTDNSSVAKETGSTVLYTSGFTKSTIADGSIGSGDTSATESTVPKLSSKSEETDSTRDSTVSPNTDSSSTSGETSASDSTNTDLSSNTDSSSTSGETSASDSTNTDLSSNTDSSSTSGETSASDSTNTDLSSNTDSSSTSGKTSASDSINTDLSSSSGGTDSTESTVTDVSTTSRDTKATVTDVITTSRDTKSTVTDGSSTSGDTDTTESTGTDVSSTSESIISAEPTNTDQTSTTDETGSTESTITDKSSITEETTFTESTVTKESSTAGVTSESTSTEGTDSTGSSITGEPWSTDISDTTGSLVSESESTSTTQSSITDATSTTETSTHSGSTIKETTQQQNYKLQTIVSVIDSDLSVDMTSNERSESTIESSTLSSIESSESTTELKSESTTEAQGTTTTSESDSTMTTESRSTLYIELDPTTASGLESTTISESESTTLSGSESTTSTELESSIASDSDSTTITGPESSTTSEEESSISSETVSITGSSLSTEEPGIASTSGSESDSTTISEPESSTTSEQESSTSSETVSTTESNLSTEELEISSSSGPESVTTEVTKSSSLSTAETTESSEMNTTTDSATASGLTTEETTSSVRVIFGNRLSQKDKCQRRRKLHCRNSKFGCCPDKKTRADGPFQEGCNITRTCLETKYRCCPDGVTPAQGNNYKGCPPPTPCEETLFGCCQSDNKTAAEGNDEEGCPPACKSSTYGCCADEETEATGPNFEGCPEYTTEMSSTESSITETFTDTSTPIDTETETETDTSTGSTESTEFTETSTISEESTTLSVSSTIEEDCGGSEFGCCYDNETAASGPDRQGCPCNTTEFGCCPDGIYPAQGENNLGCQGACRDSPHGCCQDNETPAHGPQFEGCCAQTAYGCCPDNRQAAKGPHEEGCSCNDSLHGCCPGSNSTAALGPNNEGCGCQHTEFGCCPDRHTTASGPDYKGCSCHTFQFGCCPDGVTVAKEPQKQDCDCRFSTYGCCGDSETPALGPDYAGCDCSASKYGCCPDGVSVAAGPRFQECTDLPENKQAVCSLPKDMGPGTDYKPLWFYDMSYGGCSYFWYGGTEGNGNRFASQAECQDTCIHPDPKDACKLPGVPGPCDNNLVRWYYNSTVEQCVPFRYGGCLGNSNNFDSRELCQKQCEPDRTTDTCNLPIEEGPCAGNFSRWGFNSKSRTCEQFTWGGCDGNSNRFNSEAACEMRCNPPNVAKPECSLPPRDAGNCTNKEALWTFVQSEDRCMPFYYTGCGGNDNKFHSRQDCEQTCPRSYEPEMCTLPADVGTCSQYRTNWYYDTIHKSCRTFYYGGCGGNENNFATQAACENACNQPTTTTVKPQTPPATVAPDRPFSYTEYCFHEIDLGVECPPVEKEMRYAYDKDVGKCVRFQYLGCGGTRNNFPTEEHCVYYCHTAQDVCQLPMMSGPCDDSVMSWFYDPYTDSCSQFTYGGCEGNANRFNTREDCEKRCRSELSAVTTTTTTKALTTNAVPNQDSVPPECRTSGFEECRSSGEVWFFDPQQQACMGYMNEDRGFNCRYRGTFQSQEACERLCGAFRGIDVCVQTVDPGPCTNLMTKVYFDQESHTCKEFVYSGCLGGANRFSSIEECANICKAETDLCLLPPEQGDCTYRYEQWYYNASSAQCSLFIYTGCGGNDNRFDSRQDCEARCAHPATTTTVASIIPPDTREECRTPASLSPCGRNQTVFYYDSNSKSCLAGEFGQCGYSNSYTSEEECERECGAFRNTNVCQASLDPGPCRNTALKFYFDSATGRCQPFSYSGCGGGPNRFTTVEECEHVCAGFGPAPPCLQELDSGFSNGCDQPSVPRYHYSTARADCIRFVYQGCGGNNNNFYSYEQCRQYCTKSGPNEVGCESYEEQCAALVCPYGVVKTSAPGGCESCACVDQATYCQRYSQECATLNCPYGMMRTPMSGGCERCTCVDQATHCEQSIQECDSLVCPYGINRIQDNGCERCTCHEDPCSSANCTSKELCISMVYNDQVTQQKKYTARCVPNYDINVITDCSRFQEECENLKCEFGKQRIRTSDGCERCECITVQIDCAPLEEECSRLKCAYGTEKTTGKDGCVRCKCLEHPCASITCAPGERCIVVAYREPITHEPKYSTECRTVLKPGDCPVNDVSSSALPCRIECHDDAECRGVGKCCNRGCSQLCLPPAPPTTQPPKIFTTTYAPNIPAAPVALAPTEPEVSATEGGKATLRCLFHSNPPPKITWTRGEITIDGNVGRYRLLSDGALEIVSLYRNDTGVYICIADNGLGIARQEVNLIVNDPVETPVGISGEENAVVTGELNRPLQVRCMVYGYPPADVRWLLHGDLVPFNNADYEARGNNLLIRRLTINTLGQYTCQAYNGIGKPASWAVSVRAYRPEGYLIDHEYLVPRYNVPLFATTLSPFRTTRGFLPTTTTTTTTTTERQIMFTVPVNAHMKTTTGILNIGADLRLECELDGFPEPSVHWTKDGVVIDPDDRISISGSETISRLVVSRVTVSDSGLYRCNANNGYTSHSDNAQINVQQIRVPAKCTDNPYFAKCELIVQNKYCHHKYYSKFCCKSCVEAGLLDPQWAEAQADQPYRKK